MKKIKLYLSVLMVLYFCLCAADSHAKDRSIAFGVHNLIVHDSLSDEKDSSTYGVGIEFYGNSTTKSGIEISHSLGIFIDHDRDKLDPDHIPVWFTFDIEARGKSHELSENIKLNWILDIYSKRNTVSSIEQQYLLFPGVGISSDTGKYTFGTKINAGYYFLEMDDDVPRIRGYKRGELINRTYACSIMVKAGISFSDAFDFNVEAQTWADKDVWLEHRYNLSLSYDSDAWLQDSIFKISIEHKRYNLDPYSLIDKDDRGYVPILPWDNDTFIRAYFIISWT